MLPQPLLPSRDPLRWYVFVVAATHLLYQVLLDAQVKVLVVVLVHDGIYLLRELQGAEEAEQAQLSPWTD
jgi:hypothetical protein